MGDPGLRGESGNPGRHVSVSLIHSRACSLGHGVHVRRETLVSMEMQEYQGKTGFLVAQENQERLVHLEHR